jgi:hypothetical protein
MSRIAAICRYLSIERQRPTTREANMKTLRDPRVLRAAVVGLVVWLGACITPSGPHKVGATMSGTVSGSQGGAVVGATITVTPSAASALAAIQTTAGGAFTVDNVPVGDGSVTVSNVPANCQPSTTLSYTGLKNGGTRDINIVVGCSITLP